MFWKKNKKIQNRIKKINKLKKNNFVNKKSFFLKIKFIFFKLKKLFLTILANKRNEILSNKIEIPKLLNYLKKELIKWDFGVFMADEFVSKFEEKIYFLKELNEIKIKTLIKEVLISMYVVLKKNSNELNFLNNETNIFLMCGVNGTGKTTTIAKIANLYLLKNKKILLIGGDTFRAGASEQLEFWSKKLNIECIIKSHKNEGPSSLIYKALEKNKKEKYDLIICDTSGRLQDNKNLMEELKKIYFVIKKNILKYPEETFITIDSTLGQNSFIQLQKFLEFIKVTGIVVTKIDNYERGGIIFALNNKFNIPVKFITTGEKISEIEDFSITKIINSFVKKLKINFHL